jgi:2-polyprenyl-3-methyl-5-hydroxy-6-metoxy-1,4-benzoquinol methylase
MIPNPQAEPLQIQGACGVCGSYTARELYTASDRLRNDGELWTIAECSGCGVLRTLPELSEAELARYYPDEYWGAPEPSQSWIRSSQSEKTAFLSRCGLAGGRILDVGCGSGFFLRALDSAKWERFGIEPGEAAAREAERFLGTGHVIAGSLIESGFTGSTFDVITLWSALEHANEPRANLREAKRLIKPGGSLIIQVPNAASYQARFFRGDWFALDAPRHRYHFTFPLLQQMLSNNGFEIYRATYSSKAHNSHALRQSLKARLLRRDSTLHRALFLASIPLIKPFDAMMSALNKGATLTVAARSV